jgi:hypothetical protein
MDTNILIGIILTALSLLAVVTLTIVNNARIERIASEGCKTARETLKDKNNGK